MDPLGTVTVTFQKKSKYMPEQQLRFRFPPGEEVTRREVVFVNVFWSFFNFHCILLAKPHAAMRVCVLWLCIEGFLFRFNKPSNKSLLPFPDFAIFVALVLLMFRNSQT
jgi:hypothetical protein